MPNDSGPQRLPLTLEVAAWGSHWRVTLPAPDSYTQCSRARWERMEKHP